MTLQDLKQTVSSQKGLYELLDEARITKKVWKHRASSTSTFLANPLHYALAQGLGVNFGSTDKTIVGSAVHAGVDYAYSNSKDRIGLAIKSVVDEVEKEWQNL